MRVGDIDNLELGLSDDVYAYLYESQGNNENRAALEALKMLVFKYANYVEAKAGGLESLENQKYEQYKELLDKVTKDPTFSFLRSGTPFAGGINRPQTIRKGEMYRNDRSFTGKWIRSYRI